MEFVLPCPFVWFRFLELRCDYNSGGKCKHYIKDITNVFPFSIIKIKPNEWKKFGNRWEIKIYSILGQSFFCERQNNTLYCTYYPRNKLQNIRWARCIHVDHLLDFNAFLLVLRCIRCQRQKEANKLDTAAALDKFNYEQNNQKSDKHC